MIARAAARDIEEIGRYSLQHFGSGTARRYLNDLEAAMLTLTDHLRSGANVPELAPYRCLSCRQHRIFYRVGGGAVQVERVLHQAMDALRWLDRS